MISQGNDSVPQILGMMYNCKKSRKEFDPSVAVVVPVYFFFFTRLSGL